MGHGHGLLPAAMESCSQSRGGQNEEPDLLPHDMNVEDKVNTRLDMIGQDGSPGHMHMINYVTKYRDEIFQHANIKLDTEPSSIEELAISHLHSYLGMRGYI